MFIRLLSPALAVLIIACSLYLWRYVYAVSDWAVACLVPLSVLLFLAQMPILREDYRARMLLTLRPGSRLTRILTGRLSSSAGALVFVAISIPVLAWQALHLTPAEAGLVSAACMISGWVFVGIERRLARSFNPPFARAYALRLSSWLCAALACPVIAWVTWSYTGHPPAYLQAGFIDALKLGMSEMPERDGLLETILMPFYAFQGGKTWLLVQSKNYPWLTLLLSMDAALFGFLATRASILMTDLAEHFLLAQQTTPSEDVA
ncbi:hypothetical protein [Paracoccus sp. DMF]|uniref:hypothetical protein n=1 Tax=Paracoccus sp. DMF TaxID=400837 RepID=UPI00110514F5|nr:hypothetical protein [Paracoccus sp. DMF]MCV2447478.1 hypothetical protein [Paracoccus sp. DMF]